MSGDEEKSAHTIPLALAAHGYEILAVNPRLVGQPFVVPVVAELSQLAPAPELVLVFRPSAEAPGIARAAVSAGAKALWLQQGIVSAEARQIAEGAGLLYVEDQCAAVVRSLHRIEARVSES